jgi:hypothetical protein
MNATGLSVESRIILEREKIRKGEMKNQCTQC